MKYEIGTVEQSGNHQSRPARGAWVEMLVWYESGVKPPESRPARGAWVEISHRYLLPVRYASRPARGAWVEITMVEVLKT